MKLRTIVWLAPAASLALYSGACSSSSSQAVADAGSADASADAAVDIEGVHYQPHGAGDDLLPLAGGPSDDALRALLVQSVSTTSGPSVPAFDAPASGATLDPTTPPTFTWHGPTACAPRWRDRAPMRPPSFWEALRPERTAHAHLPPYNGIAYYLELSTPKRGAVYRLFTAFTRGTPDPASWQELASSGETVRATLRLARFTDSRLDPDGSPFEAAPLTFTVHP